MKKRWKNNLPFHSRGGRLVPRFGARCVAGVGVRGRRILTRNLAADSRKGDDGGRGWRAGRATGREVLFRLGRPFSIGILCEPLGAGHERPQAGRGVAAVGLTGEK